MVLEVITLVLALGYALIILWFMQGWKRLIRSKKTLLPVESKPFEVSLIIPFRNEFKHLPSILDAINKLELDGLVLEIIWVDDQSEDGGCSLISEQLLQHSNWKLLRTKDELTGKKAALSLGINASSYNWIVCTDADCTFGPFWLQSMASTAIHTEADLVSGPVLLVGTSWFQRLQALEFMSLNAIGGACLALKKPVIANGANLMYKKSCWQAVGGFEPHIHRASGDDDLLLHQLNEVGFKLKFCLDKAAIVETQACNTFSSFIQQRLRWISKSGSYKRKDITAILTMVWVYLALVVALFIVGQWQWAVCLWAIKWLVDGIFLWSPAHFYNLSHDWKWLPLVQLFYLPYVLLAGLAGNFTGYQWKGRKHQ